MGRAAFLAASIAGCGGGGDGLEGGWMTGFPLPNGAWIIAPGTGLSTL
jgi:hypothetical protein